MPILLVLFSSLFLALVVFIYQDNIQKQYKRYIRNWVSTLIYVVYKGFADSCTQKVSKSHIPGFVLHSSGYYISDYIKCDCKTQELQLRDADDIINRHLIQLGYDLATTNSSIPERLVQADLILQTILSENLLLGSSLETLNTLKNLNVMEWGLFKAPPKSSFFHKLLSWIMMISQGIHKTYLDNHNISFRNQTLQAMTMLVEKNKKFIILNIDEFKNVASGPYTTSQIITRVIYHKFNAMKLSLIMDWIYRDFSESLGYTDLEWVKQNKTPIELRQDILNYLTSINYSNTQNVQKYEYSALFKKKRKEKSRAKSGIIYTAQRIYAQIENML